jgi:hypothetical protein
MISKYTEQIQKGTYTNILIHTWYININTHTYRYIQMMIHTPAKYGQDGFLRGSGWRSLAAGATPTVTNTPNQLRLGMGTDQCARIGHGGRPCGFRRDFQGNWTRAARGGEHRVAKSNANCEIKCLQQLCTHALGCLSADRRVPPHKEAFWGRGCGFRVVKEQYMQYMQIHAWYYWIHSDTYPYIQIHTDTYAQTDTHTRY